MQNSTRRAFLQGTAAVAAGAAAPIPAIAAVGPDHPDAELLELERHILQETAKLDAAGLISDDELDAWSEQLCQMETRLAEMPARTPEGIAVKLRRINEYFAGETAYDRSYFRTAFEALRRLAGRT